MDVATEFLEFFLPIKYQGAPAEQKVGLVFSTHHPIDHTNVQMLHYSEEQYVSKIRRFAAFIGLAMTIDALFEVINASLIDTKLTVDQLSSCPVAWAVPAFTWTVCRSLIMMECVAPSPA